MLDTVPLLSAVDVYKAYRKDKMEVPVLNGVELEVRAGEFLSVVGASGSGKSTLLHLLGTLDRPDHGRIHLSGERIDNLPAERRDQLRNKTFGFILQFYHLLPELTTLENVLVPQMIAHSVLGWFARRGALRRLAAEWLDRVGLGHRLKHRPRELSGGEMQRAAIARALVNRPRVLLADEPTGELDTAAAASVFDALQTANAELGVTILLVSHDPAVAGRVRRTVAIRDGRTSTELLRHDTTDEAGNAATHAVEYAVMDRAGRVQLPREMTRPLGMRERVRLESTPDHIGVWPDRGRDPEQPEPPVAAAAPPASAAGPAATVRSRERAPLPPGDTVVAATDITRTFGTGDSAVQALRGVTFTIAGGQFAVL